MLSAILVAALLAATATAVRGATLVSAASGAAARLGVPPMPARAHVRRWLVAPARVGEVLECAAAPWPAEAVWRGWLAAVAAAAVGGTAVGGVGAGAAAVAVVAAGPPAVAWWCRDRADRLLEASLPDALEQVAAGLRSGGGLLDALAAGAEATPGPVGDDLAVVVAEARHGSLAAGLDRWAARRPLPGVTLAVAALAVGNHTGGAHARAVDGVAATLRDRVALRAELRALSSQARASAVVIAVAPVAFGAMAALTDPRYAAFLFRTPLGLACLVGGLLLDAGGAWWMASLTKGRE